MMTLYDLGMEVQKIRTSLENIEVKGQKNASLLVGACLSCEKIIDIINETGKALSEKADKPAESKNSEGDVNAQYTE